MIGLVLLSYFAVPFALYAAKKAKWLSPRQYQVAVAIYLLAIAAAFIVLIVVYFQQSGGIFTPSKRAALRRTVYIDEEPGFFFVTAAFVLFIPVMLVLIAWESLFGDKSGKARRPMELQIQCLPAPQHFEGLEGRAAFSTSSAFVCPVCQAKRIFRARELAEVSSASWAGAPRSSAVRWRLLEPLFKRAAAVFMAEDERRFTLDFHCAGCRLPYSVGFERRGASYFPRVLWCSSS